MRRLRDPLLRTAFRAGYWGLRAYWLVARPQHHGVKCVIARNGDVLLVRHTYGKRTRWELPGGGVKRREAPLVAARREMAEELGVELADWRSLGVLFERIDGKRDTLTCLTTDVADLPLALDRAEIAEARWFPRDALPREAGPGVRRILALRYGAPALTAGAAAAAGRG